MIRGLLVLLATILLGTAAVTLVNLMIFQYQNPALTDTQRFLAQWPQVVLVLASGLPGIGVLSYLLGGKR